MKLYLKPGQHHDNFQSILVHLEETHTQNSYITKVALVFVYYNQNKVTGYRGIRAQTINAVYDFTAANTSQTCLQVRLPLPSR